MLWVVAFFVTIAAMMVGIGRWRRANDPLHALDERNRKVWERENDIITINNDFIDEFDDDTTVNPIYSILPGNINHHE